MMIKLFILLSLNAETAEKVDTRLCSYWLDKLGQIASLETRRIEIVPQILLNEGHYAATDYDIDLRARILAIMAKIEKENKQ